MRPSVLGSRHHKAADSGNEVPMRSTLGFAFSHMKAKPPVEAADFADLKNVLLWK